MLWLLAPPRPAVRFLDAVDFDPLVLEEHTLMDVLGSDDDDILIRGSLSSLLALLFDLSSSEAESVIPISGIMISLSSDVTVVNLEDSDNDIILGILLSSSISCKLESELFRINCRLPSPGIFHVLVLIVIYLFGVVYCYY